MEQLFADYLGVKKVIWLERGIAGDDTHGHVDDITRFVAPRTVVTAYEPDPQRSQPRAASREFSPAEPEHRPVGQAAAGGEAAHAAPVYLRGQRLPASYANFYIANKLVLVPIFDDPNDRIALNTLAELFPGREVVGIYCRDFIWGLGALHCMTQQQPPAARTRTASADRCADWPSRTRTAGRPAHSAVPKIGESRLPTGGA